MDTTKIDKTFEAMRPRGNRAQRRKTQKSAAYKTDLARVMVPLVDRMIADVRARAQTNHENPNPDSKE